MDKYFDFVFGSQNIDITVDDTGVAWLQGPQVASILGYIRPSDMYRMLDPREADLHNVQVRSTNGVEQIRKVVMINEFGVYRLIMLSRRPEAKEFQNWLYYQVLPSIRRYGAYIDAETRQILEEHPDALHILNQHITKLNEQNAQLQEQVFSACFPKKVSDIRLNNALFERDFYFERALFYQRLLGIIDDYCFGDAETLKRVVQDTLDQTNNIDPLERNNEKQLLYRVYDKNKG